MAFSHFHLFFASMAIDSYLESDLPRLESLNCIPESNAMGLHAFNRSELPFRLLAFVPFACGGGEVDMRRRIDDVCK